MEDQEMHLKVKKVTEKFTESMYFLANEPSLALYRLQEHVRRSLPELVQHKTDMQGVEEQCQGAIYTVEYACSAVKSMSNSGAYFKNIEGLLRRAISIKDQMSSLQSRRAKRAPLPFQCWMVYSVNNGRNARSGPREEKGSDGIRF
ncbi:BLOC-1-related complex subunit 8 isoform X6 [Scyliorhinus torazame]|uniref:BLOC-1-related complex subunit 8 isoform X2 n=1 Tax=Scyliorhinus canicula TaxID=7830 RepID=UPI0018F468E9|nr:BLOC-1-related complex subunit 8 isoform X2 [Scyliorhinus canicula]